MSAIHASRALGGVVCPTRSWTRASTHTGAVTCKRCLRLLPLLAAAAEAAEREQRTEARYTAACEALGVSHVWNAISTETPTERLMRGIFGAVVLALHEQGRTADLDLIAKESA